MQKHVCCGCGNEAHFQMKNGKWYCCQNYRSCPGINDKNKQKTILYWKQLHQRGINKRSEIPIEQRKRLIIKNQPKNICHYCGEYASFQLSNGRWCCCETFHDCKGYRKKLSIAAKKQNNSKYLIPWSKGLTKQTDQRLKKKAERARIRYENGKIIPSFKGKHHSKQTKQKISKAVKKYISDNNIYWNRNKNKFKNGYYKGYWCDSSWELAFVIYNLEHNILFERNRQGFEYQFNNQKHKYFPDFKLSDGTFIQIKGILNQNAKIKINSFKQPLIVLDKETIKPYLKYTIQTYGKDFYKLYQNNTYKDKNYIICPICKENKMLKKSKMCTLCFHKQQTSKNKPTKEILKNELEKNSYAALSRKYNVSHTSIRKWCKSYGILKS